MTRTVVIKTAKLTLSMVVKYKHKFLKMYEKAPAKIRLAFIERAKIFQNDHFNPLLSNHALKGKYLGFRSINITGDWRAVFREFNNYSLVEFETLGTHSQLYK